MKLLYSFNKYIIFTKTDRMINFGTN